MCISFLAWCCTCARLDEHRLLQVTAKLLVVGETPMAGRVRWGPGPGLIAEPKTSWPWSSFPGLEICI